jgi:MscS family membrane protein
MRIPDLVLNFLENELTQAVLLRTGIFLLFILLSFLIGQYTPKLLRFLVYRFFPKKVSVIYHNLIEPVSNQIRITATLILIYLSLGWIEEYEPVYNFLVFFLDLGVISSVAWLFSRLFHQFMQVYGIELIRKYGAGIDEFLLVFETIVNVVIGIIAVLSFAKGRFDLFGLVAGLGIGGLAIAFAAQSTLEQLLGTIVLYLDRPFVPGEYIRIPRSSRLTEEFFGRIESIGMRSTKIRIAAKSTLLIVPNSILANLEIENITRGKKMMVLLFLDFTKKLDDREQAIVKQVIKDSTDLLFGIDPGSTSISLISDEEEDKIKARVSFFILGSTENSMQLRKRLLELASSKISKKLKTYGIAFNIQEPNIYVESPVTI